MTTNEYTRLADRLRDIDIKLSNEIYSVFEGLGEAKDELEQKIADINLQDVRNLLTIHSQDFARVNQRMEAMYKVCCDRLAILDDENRKLRADVQALTKRLDELDEANKEAIEQAIAQMSLDSGLAHL